MIERDFFTTEELFAKKSGTFVFDVEVYQNYFLAAFKCIQTNKYAYFEAVSGEKLPADWLSWMLSSYCIVGFNSKHFDLLILAIAISNPNATVEMLKEATDDIIYRDMRSAEIEMKYDCAIQRTNDIDLIEVTPLHGSLKLYGARLHCRHIQDLPFDPATVLTREQIAITRTYCFNDLDVTQLVTESLSEQLELRANLSTQYHQDLRSKSDAQIAEAVISSELHRLTGKRPKRPKIDPSLAYTYKVPPWMKFETEQLQSILAEIQQSEFRVTEAGHISIPKSLTDKSLRIGDGIYRMGIGGLHSSEQRKAYISTDNVMLIDRDVTGYYPNIILSLGLFPPHIGQEFLEVYGGIVDRRTLAKKKKEYIEAESLKITTNGTFGKLGSPYSFLFAPELLTQVTLTGQLGLLMLIEQLEAFDIQVISANTDGIISRLADYMRPIFNAIFSNWENLTHFQTEETLYKAVCSRDVNNYIAIGTDGEVKAKGAYSNPWDNPKKQFFRLFKNPQAMIVIDAAVARITNGTPVEETIRNCQEIQRFVVVRNATGGAQKDGKYLGKVIRWYYANGVFGSIVRCTNGHTVAMSEGGKPLMTLPEHMPTDINYAVYANAATEILEDIAFQERRNEQLRLI